MQDTKYDKIEITGAKMKICLEFPRKKESEEAIRRIEPIVFEAIAQYIGKLQENEDVFIQIEENQNREKNLKKAELEREQQELNKIRSKIAVMESNIPDAMTGEYPLSLEELVSLIKKQKEQQAEIVSQKEAELKNANVSIQDWEEIRTEIPTWQQVFLNADPETKRVLVTKLVDRIEITKSQVNVRFKINLNDFFTLPRISGDHGEGFIYYRRKRIERNEAAAMYKAAVFGYN